MGREHLKIASSFEGTSDEAKGFLLALCAWREARGEGKSAAEKLDAMRAVMHVIRNRVAAGWGDWDAVISGRNQFSSISVRGDSQLVEWPDDSLGLWMATLGLANTVYHGRDTDPTRGALYYFNPRTADSVWFTQNIVAKPALHPKVAVLGQHEFFA